MAIKANGRPVVFYLAIENLNGCDENRSRNILLFKREKVPQKAFSRFLALKM
jgi:hypothetical protein